MCLCQADLLKSKLANKGCCQGRITCSRPKNRRKVANHDRLIFPFSANFTPANKAAHAFEQSELEQSDFVWKFFCRVSALTVSKSSPLFQIMHQSQKIIGASVLSGSSSPRFRESQVSSNVNALILPIAY